MLTLLWLPAGLLCFLSAILHMPRTARRRRRDLVRTFHAYLETPDGHRWPIQGQQTIIGRRHAGPRSWRDLLRRPLRADLMLTVPGARTAEQMSSLDRFDAGHLQILCRPDGYFVEPLQSRSPLFLRRGNDRPQELPQKPVPLHHGDRILLGPDYTLTFYHGVVPCP